MAAYPSKTLRRVNTENDSVWAATSREGLLSRRRDSKLFRTCMAEQFTVTETALDRFDHGATTSWISAFFSIKMQTPIAASLVRY